MGKEDKCMQEYQTYSKISAETHDWKAASIIQEMTNTIWGTDTSQKLEREIMNKFLPL